MITAVVRKLGPDVRPSRQLRSDPKVRSLVVETCKTCGSKYLIVSASEPGRGICDRCAQEEREPAEDALRCTPSPAGFACKICAPGAELATGATVEFPDAGLAESDLRDAAVEIRDGSLRVISQDARGHVVTVHELSVEQVDHVTAQTVRADPQSGQTLGKSLAAAAAVGSIVAVIGALCWGWQRDGWAAMRELVAKHPGLAFGFFGAYVALGGLSGTLIELQANRSKQQGSLIAIWIWTNEQNPMVVFVGPREMRDASTVFRFTHLTLGNVRNDV